MMSLPGVSKEQEFVLERPFVPRSKANQLSSFMVARNDPAHYGQLVLYQMPTDSVAPSPSRAASLIEANPTISKQFSLLDQRGSSVIRGQAQLIPIGNSIFYVRPIFVQGKGSGSFPRWNYVAVTYGEQAVLDDTSVADAINHLLARTQPTLEPNGGTTTPTTQPPGGGTVASLLAQADGLTAQANRALADLDLAAYQRIIKQQQALIEQASKLAAQSSSTTTTSTPGSTSTSTSAPRTTTTVGHA
jgi:uncharacterized membrane protein (UPF0182 family)